MAKLNKAQFYLAFTLSCSINGEGCDGWDRHSAWKSYQADDLDDWRLEHMQEALEEEGIKIEELS